MTEFSTRPIDAIRGTIEKFELYAERIAHGQFEVEDAVKLIETKRQLEAQVAVARAEDETIGTMLDELA